MSDHHEFPSRDRLNVLPDQSVTITDFESDGYILDIGGGGEGVIGQVKGSRVIAVDNRREELMETSDDAHKIVMDACRLAFPDSTFATATAFFTLMFIHEPSHRPALQEIYRVLRPGGRLYIWDVAVPPRADDGRDVTAFNLEIRLPHRTLRTGYGGRSPDTAHDMAYYRRLATEVGFDVAARKQEQAVIILELTKGA